MELFLIPFVGIAGLYFIKKQDEKRNIENFSKKEDLPNINTPDKNYSDTYQKQNTTDYTSNLINVNKYDNQFAYTDKYFTNSTDLDKKQEQKNTPTEYKSVTGKIVDINYFQHNNMVPYFGSKSHSNNKSNSNEATLDNYTGSGSQYKIKKESSPMFQPSINNEWANGMPSTTDFIQSRQNPSSKMANVKLFEPMQVGPGLGLSSDQKSSDQGYNNGMMARELWIDKNVDQLRSSNKTKSSGTTLYGREGPAKSYVSELGTIGIVEKNRVDKTFELGRDRLFTTTGVEKGQTLRPTTIERMVNRSTTSTDYIGNAGYSNSTKQMDSNYLPSRNIQNGPLPMLPANARGRNFANENDYGIKSNVSYANNRSINEKNDYFGIIGGTIKNILSPILDVLRPSRRENVLVNLRPYQDIKSSISSSYTFNEYDVPDITNRETMENSLNHMNITGSNLGAYQQTGITTPSKSRDITNSQYYSGNASSANSKPRTYEAEYNQRNNDNKSSTIHGRMSVGNLKLMGNTMNMTSKSNDDLLLNTRPVHGNRLTSMAPSINSMGITQGMDHNVNSKSQSDRNDGLHTQLNDNPYHYDINNIL